MNRQINWNLKCVIDGNIDDRKREPAHCHIEKNGTRVAYVDLKSASISNSDLDRSELREVESFISRYKYDLIDDYMNGL